MTVLIGKLAIALIGCLLTILLLRSRALFQMGDRVFERLVLLCVILSRLAIFIALYGILHYEVPSDIPAGYYPPAVAALAGKLVYRDFFTTYGPLFPYACAVGLAIYNSMKSIVFLAIVMEILGVAAWLKFGRITADKRLHRTAAALYVFNPLLLSTVAVTGQNHVWMSPFLAIAALAAISNRSALSGFWLSACTLVTKFLAFFFVLPLLAIARNRLVFLTSFCAISAAAYGSLLLAGADVLAPLRFQRSVGQESSANLPYLLSSLGIPMTALAYPAIAAICLAVLFLLIWRIDGRVNVCTTFSYSLVAVFVILLLFSKKAFTSYWIAAFFPLCFVWSDRIVTAGRLTIFLAWSCISALEPSLYFRWTNVTDLSGIASWFSSAPIHALVFLLIQIGLVLFSGLLLFECYGWYRRLQGSPPSEDMILQPEGTINK